MLVVALASGCGSNDGSVEGTETTEEIVSATDETTPEPPDSTSPTDTTDASDPAPATTRPLSNTDLPIMTQPQPPPKQPTDSFQPVTLRGRIELGTEEGCVELVTDGGRYVLVGVAVDDVTAGDDVVVSATPAPQLLSMCNGGPIIVTDIKPA